MGGEVRLVFNRWGHSMCAILLSGISFWYTFLRFIEIELGVRSGLFVCTKDEPI
jgi:uncharacterized membrane protein